MSKKIIMRRIKKRTKPTQTDCTYCTKIYIQWPMLFFYIIFLLNVLNVTTFQWKMFRISEMDWFRYGAVSRKTILPHYQYYYVVESVDEKRIQISVFEVMFWFFKSLMILLHETKIRTGNTVKLITNNTDY